MSKYEQLENGEHKTRESDLDGPAFAKDVKEHKDPKKKKPKREAGLEMEQEREDTSLEILSHDPDELFYVQFKLISSIDEETSKKLTLTLSAEQLGDFNVQQFKTHIFKVTQIPVLAQQLYFSLNDGKVGKILKDDNATLFEIQENMDRQDIITIHVIVKHQFPKDMPGAEGGPKYSTALLATLVEREHKVHMYLMQELEYRDPGRQRTFYWMLVLMLLVTNGLMFVHCYYLAIQKFNADYVLFLYADQGNSLIRPNVFIPMTLLPATVGTLTGVLLYSACLHRLDYTHPSLWFLKPANLFGGKAIYRILWFLMISCHFVTVLMAIFYSIEVIYHGTTLPPNLIGYVCILATFLGVELLLFAIYLKKTIRFQNWYCSHQRDRTVHEKCEVGVRRVYYALTSMQV